MRFHWHTHHLTLTNPWGIARGVSKEKEGWVFEIEHAGVIGHGEAAHTKRNGESLESVKLDFERVAAAAAGKDDPRAMLDGDLGRGTGHPDHHLGVRSALDRGDVRHAATSASGCLEGEL